MNDQKRNKSKTGRAASLRNHQSRIANKQLPDYAILISGLNVDEKNYEAF